MITKTSDLKDKKLQSCRNFFLLFAKYKVNFPPSKNSHSEFTSKSSLKNNIRIHEVEGS